MIIKDRERLSPAEARTRAEIKKLSDDLIDPLTAIQIYASACKRLLEDGIIRGVPESLTAMLEQCNRMALIVRQMRKMSDTSP